MIDTKALILARLQQGSCTKQELKAGLPIGVPALRSILSRLRNEGWDIIFTSGVYKLLHGPGGLGTVFQCPACHSQIRLGHLSDHANGCRFGTLTVKELTS
jgi:hypothetical protein